MVKQLAISHKICFSPQVRIISGRENSLESFWEVNQLMIKFISHDMGLAHSSENTLYVVAGQIPIFNKV